MQQIFDSLTLYCVYIWIISISCSFSAKLNKTVFVNRDSNHSKYIYYVEDETTNSVYSAVETTSEIHTTDTSIDICNSSLDDLAFFKRKRWIKPGQNITTTVKPNTVDISILSDEFLNCTHTTVEPECYRKFPNGSVFVPLYNMFFDRANYVIHHNLLFVCPNFFDIFEEKFSSAIAITSIVGVCISTLFIIFHMIMFVVVEKLRNRPGYCLVSLCISLLIAYLSFFIQFRKSGHTGCKVIGMMRMYGFLASFFWMNVISFDVWHSIRLATAKLLLSSNQSMFRRFILYSIYAWGMPLLIIIIAVIVDNVSEVIEYQLVFRMSICWFQYRQALLVYFALPLFVVLTLNLFFFVTSFVMITRSRSDSGAQESYDLRSRLFLSLRLGSAMGLMWIFGVIATATEREWINYLHSLCNALQGLFIFFSFTFNKRTKNACKEVIQKKKSSILPSTSPTFQSTKF